MKRAFIYTRVSTLEQAKGGYSISEQESRLKAYAKAKNFEVVKVYRDAGYSGAKLKRPALQEMINNIKTVDVVIVYKLDRLSRSQKDTLYLIEEVFMKNNVNFVSLNESFDTTSSFGRAMIGILSVFAQLEREQIKERFAMGKVGRAKKGKWHGTGKYAPFGYVYKKGELIIDKYQSAIVRRVFELSSEGYGISKLYKQIDKEFPGAITNESTIVRIRKNRIYIGEVFWDGEYYKGEHEPIVTFEQFHTVQNLLERRKSQYAQPRTSSYLLTGIIYCLHCGARLYGQSGSQRKDGTRRRYYKCITARKPHIEHPVKCSSKLIPRDDIEIPVLNEINKIKLSEVELKKDNNIDTSALEHELSNVDKQLNKLLDLYLLDNIDFNRLDSKNTELTKNKNKLLLRIEEIESKAQIEEETTKIIKSLSDVDLRKIDIDKARIIISLLIDRIDVSENDINIHWNV